MSDVLAGLIEFLGLDEFLVIAISIQLANLCLSFWIDLGDIERKRKSITREPTKSNFSQIPSLSLPLLCCLFSFPKSCRNGKNYMNLTFLNAFKDARIPLLALSSSFMVSKQRWRLDIPPSAFAEILSQTTLQYGDKFAVSKRSTTVRLAL